MEIYKTEQESFWAGEFGNSWISRTQNTPSLVARNVAFFSKILDRTSNIETVIEFGAGEGCNLKALKTLKPSLKCTAVEINEQAATILQASVDASVDIASILEYQNKNTFDLVLAKAILIHINPPMLRTAYEVLYKASKKYILLAEYYNPVPIDIVYRGHAARLFKRDFAGEMLDLFPNLTLLDYGFTYHRDNNFPQDDLHWFLLKKN